MSTENATFHKNAYVGWVHTNGNYYPPDFDPKAIVPNRKHQEKMRKNKGMMSMNMRMMMPFSMNCNTCGEFMYIGTKFNSRMEKLQESTYLDIPVYRFYGFCKSCRAEFTFKTNPKDGNYIMESGGSRQYEAFADAGAVETQLKSAEELAKEDAMAALEQKRVDMEREMQAHDDLDRLMAMNKRGGRDTDTLNRALDALFSGNQIDETTSAALVGAGVELRVPGALTESSPEPDDEDLEDEVAAFVQMQKEQKKQQEDDQSQPASSSEQPQSSAAGSTFVSGLIKAGKDEAARKTTPKRKRPGVVFGSIKKKTKPADADADSASASASPEPSSSPETPPLPSGGLGSLVGNYASSDSDN